MKVQLKKKASKKVKPATFSDTVKKTVRKKGRYYAAKDPSYNVKIKCKDCGQIRWVKPSDAHHVERCLDCSIVYKRAQSALRMAKYRAKMRKTVKVSSKQSKSA